MWLDISFSAVVFFIILVTAEASFFWGGGGWGYWGDTFRLPLGSVIRDLLPQLFAVLHGTEALVHNNYPRAPAASTCLALICRRTASGVPWFLGSTAMPMKLPNRCMHYQCSVTVEYHENRSRELDHHHKIKCKVSGEDAP